MKSAVGDLRAVERKLRTMGASRAGDFVELDTYYNHPSRNFADTDEALRIRICGKKAILTYKGPKMDTKSKSREELNIPVPDAGTARTMVGRLGFRKVADVRKKRRIYTLGDFEICLDRVEGLGPFVEVEIRTSKREYPSALKSALSLLEKLDNGKTERKSYLEMLLSRQD